MSISFPGNTILATAKTPLVTRLMNVGKGAASATGPLGGFLAVTAISWYATPLVMRGWYGDPAAPAAVAEQAVAQTAAVASSPATTATGAAAHAATGAATATQGAGFGTAIYSYATGLFRSQGGSAATPAPSPPAVQAPHLSGAEKLNRWGQAFTKVWQGDARPAAGGRSDAGSSPYHAQGYAPVAPPRAAYAPPQAARQAAPASHAESFPARGGYTAAPRTNPGVTGPASGRFPAPAYRAMPRAGFGGGFRSFGGGGGHFGGRR